MGEKIRLRRVAEGLGAADWNRGREGRLCVSSRTVGGFGGDPPETSKGFGLGLFCFDDGHTSSLSPGVLGVTSEPSAINKSSDFFASSQKHTQRTGEFRSVFYSLVHILAYCFSFYKRSNIPNAC